MAVLWTDLAVVAFEQIPRTCSLESDLSGMQTLRQRIRKTKIRCQPWRMWKGEINLLPISAQTLFANYGLPIDKFERALKEEGWLFEDEVLLEVLKTDLYRPLIQEIGNEDADFGLVPDDFEEEDYNLINTVPF